MSCGMYARGLLAASCCVVALMASAPGAFAADTVVSGGSVTSTQFVSGNDTLSVDASGDITVPSQAAINWSGGSQGSNVVITNNGIIRDNSPTGVPLLLTGNISAGSLTLNNTGLIESSTTAGNNVSSLYFATLGGGASVTITNSGTIRNAAAVGDTAPGPFPDPVISFNNGSGVVSGATFTLNNSGTIVGGIAAGSGPTTLNFTTGSTVTGIITGNNNITMNLSGVGNGFAYGSFEGNPTTNTFFGWAGIFNFNVNSGNWTLVGGGSYRNTTIASGATLAVCTVFSACPGRDTAKGDPVGSGILVDGIDTVTIASGGALTTNGAAALHWGGNATGNGILITNNGLLSSTATSQSPVIINDGDRTGTLTIVNAGMIETTSAANTAPLLYFATLGSGATVVVTNSGTIRSAAAVGDTAPGPFPDPAISFNNGSGTLSSAAFTLNNSGTIIGDVAAPSGPTTMNFTTGSTVTGIITGNNNITMNLSGVGNGFAYGSFEGNSTTNTFFGWAGIFNFNVNSGNWTLVGGGSYRNTTIASGATLAVCTVLAACPGRDLAKGTPTGSGILIDGIDTVTIASGGTLTTNGGSALHWGGNATGGGILVTNNGTLSSSASFQSPVIINDGDRTGALTIVNTGTIATTDTANTAPLLYFATLGSGASVTVTNSGTIRSAAAMGDAAPGPFPDPAITFNNGSGTVSSAAFTLNNSGTIVGGVGAGTGPTTMNFTTGSTVTGVITGNNNITMNLSGAGTGFVYGSFEGTPTATTFFGWGGIFNFNVNQGSWTLVGAGSYRNTVIASGAALTACTVLSACPTRDLAKGNPTGTGILIDGIDTVTVNAGGLFASTGAALHWAGNATGDGIVVTNNGTMRSIATVPATPLIISDGDRTGTLTIVNTGLIENLSVGNTSPIFYFGTLGSGASVVVNNSGTIKSAAANAVTAPGSNPPGAISFNDGAGTVSSAAFTLTNSGTIIGSLFLGNGPSTLNFTTGSTVTGIITGSNNTTLNLSGAGSGILYGINEGASPNFSFVGWNSIFNFNVNSGSWTLIGAGSYRNTTIASGATLTVCTLPNSACGTGRQTARGTPTGSGILIDGIDTVTVASGGTLATTGTALLWGANATGAGIVITNAGTIRGASTATGSAAAGTNVATALVAASVQTSGTILQNITAGTLTVNNTGSMLSQTQVFNFNNLKTAGTKVVINNSGIISNTTTQSVFNTIINGAPAQIISNAVSGVISANQSAADITITNSGTIHGNISMGSGDNVLNLVTGSSLLGNVLTSNVTVNLSGSGTGFLMGKPEVDGMNDRFNGLVGVKTLNVNSGDWTLIGAGAFGAINVASGATFRICDRLSGGCYATYNGSNGTPTHSGISPLGTGATGVINGTVIVDTDAATVDFDTASTQTTVVSGTGKLVFTGGGVSFLSKRYTSVQIKDLQIASGRLVTSSAIDAAVVIDSGATLQIGTGGTMTNTAGELLDNGTLGNVSGSIVDNGTLIFDRVDDFTVTADLSGNGGIVKRNANTVTLTGKYTFTGTTQLLGGKVLIGGALSSDSALQVGGGASVNLQGSSQTVAGLSDAPTGGSGGSGGSSGGTTPASTVDLGGGSLTVNQASSGSFSGNLTGGGTLTINGGGSGGSGGGSGGGAGGSGSTLVLNGDSSSFTGTTNITGGTLQIGSSSNPNASLGGTVNISGGTLEVGDANAPGATLTGSVDVGSGGTLGGHGTITGSVTNSGTTAPGGSIGTLHVGGNYTFASGSLLLQEVAANGTADLLQADGAVTIANGANIQIQPEGAASSYGRVTNYTIVTGGSVSGAFSGVTSATAGLKPYLSYGPTAVNLALVRTDISLTTVAATSNQAGVAAAVEGGGAVYDAVAPASDAVVRQALDLSSGELHASLASALLQNDGMLAEAAQRSPHGDGVTFWGMDGASWSRFDASANTAAFRDDALRLAGGVDLPLGEGVRIGASAGYSRDTIEALARGSSGHVNSFALGGYAAAEDGPLSVMGGLDYAWHNIGTLRVIGFSSVSQQESADYDGNSLNLFVRTAYRLSLGDAYLEPSFAVRWSRLRTAAFSETGGSFALSAAAHDSDVAFMDVGAWLGHDFQLAGAGLSTRVFAGWEHASGDLTPFGRMTLSNGSAFNVLGAPIGPDAARISAEFGLQLSRAIGLTVSYDGRLSGQSHQNAVSAHLGWKL